jgi:hypothetical protein
VSSFESKTWGRFPRLQILTVEALLEGAQVQMPASYGTFQQAPKIRQQPDSKQTKLEI